MATRTARRRGSGPEARASHLRRAAEQAGEAFAWRADEPAPAPARLGSSAAAWLTIGLAASAGLFLAF